MIPFRDSTRIQVDHDRVRSARKLSAVRSQHAKQREVLEDVGIRTSKSGASRGLAWVLVAVALAAIAGFVLYLTI